MLLVALVLVPIDQAFERRYSFDFGAAERRFGGKIRVQRGDNFSFAVRACTLHFRELDLLAIPDVEPLHDDERIAGRRRRLPDPGLRRRLFAAFEGASRDEQSRLANGDLDVRGLHTIASIDGIQTDYVASVETR